MFGRRVYFFFIWAFGKEIGEELKFFWGEEGKIWVSGIHTGHLKAFLMSPCNKIDAVRKETYTNPIYIWIFHHRQLLNKIITCILLGACLLFSNLVKITFRRIYIFIFCFLLRKAFTYFKCMHLSNEVKAPIKSRERKWESFLTHVCFLLTPQLFFYKDDYEKQRFNHMKQKQITSCKNNINSPINKIVIDDK